jgi:hypothetical protein
MPENTDTGILPETIDHLLPIPGVQLVDIVAVQVPYCFQVFQNLKPPPEILKVHHIRPPQILKTLRGYSSLWLKGEPVLNLIQEYRRDFP